MSQALLSSAYFGPVQWFQKLHRYDRCMIERYDNYVKQTYRNRCVIAATGGPQTLTVPIERYDGSKCLMRDIRISDHGAWRHVHWNAIVSSYGESPFFDYYADDILPFFERRWKYLYDFNLDITHTVCSLLDIRPVIEPTSDYIRTEDVAADDFRDAIRPKHPCLTRRSSLALTIRCIPANTDSSPTSAFSTSCSTKDLRAYSCFDVQLCFFTLSFTYKQYMLNDGILKVRFSYIFVTFTIR